MHDDPNTPTTPEFQDEIPLPDYALLFRMHTWLENTWADHAHLDGGTPVEITEALRAIENLVTIALNREGKNYLEMLVAIHAGDFR